MSYATQNDLLLNNLMAFYKDEKQLTRMLNIITGESSISLRIVDWFVTNFAKKYYTLIDDENNKRFKVYFDYKLKLKAYSKRRFDPFCRWDRINVPHKNGTTYIQTTLGQLNFFKCAIENEVLRYIQENYTAIEADMNIRNNTTRKLAKSHQTSSATIDGCELMTPVEVGIVDDIATGNTVISESEPKVTGKAKLRKKREELSSSATKSIKKEFVDIVITFD